MKISWLFAIPRIFNILRENIVPKMPLQLPCYKVSEKKVKRKWKIVSWLGTYPAILLKAALEVPCRRPAHILDVQKDAQFIRPRCGKCRNCIIPGYMCPLSRKRRLFGATPVPFYEASTAVLGGGGHRTLNEQTSVKMRASIAPSCYKSIRFCVLQTHR